MKQRGPAERHEINRSELHKALVGGLALALSAGQPSLLAVRFVLKRGLIHVIAGTRLALIEFTLAPRRPGRLESSGQMTTDDAVRLRDALASSRLGEWVALTVDATSLTFVVGPLSVATKPGLRFPALALRFEQASQLPDPTETAVTFSGRALMDVLDAARAEFPESYLNVRVVQPVDTGSVLIRGAGFRALLPIISSSSKTHGR